MSRLPSSSGEDVVRALQRIGFAVLRQRGSHVILHHDDGRTTVVPVHRGEPLGPGLLRKIARDVGLSHQDFTRLLRA